MYGRLCFTAGDGGCPQCGGLGEVAVVEGIYFDLKMKMKRVYMPCVVYKGAIYRFVTSNFGMQG